MLCQQITALRATIPSLIRPLARPNTTKQEAFNGLKKAAIGATTDVGSFRTQWEGQQTREILEKAKKSRSKNSDLSAGNDVPVFGWTEGFTNRQPDHDRPLKQEKGA